MQFRFNPCAARTLPLAALIVLVSTNCAAPRATQQQQNTQTSSSAQVAQSPTPAQAKSVQERTPSDTVREFYTALREKRVRDAFAISIYKSAIDSLTPEEFEELRPEFEKLGDAVPAQIGIYGEQISGERATVFALISTEPSAKQEAIDVIRVGDQWVIGSRENYETVKQAGKELFFKARVDTHHEELRKVLLKIANVEAIYAAQNAGHYADLASLTASESGMRLGLREDIDALSTLGYRLAISLSPNGKGYKVNAEPLRYGRTGRLSFYTDATGMQEKDNNGKPFNPPAAKKKP
ncbi:MAG: hypothetical protein QOE33_2367 [Acidobacteriota bacterium]|nr:hypothetical protein [Acidobacteriota bacterium]